MKHTMSLHSRVRYQGSSCFDLLVEVMITGADCDLDFSTFQYVQKTYKTIQNFNKGGVAIFNMPLMPIKIGRAHV